MDTVPPGERVFHPAQTGSSPVGGAWKVRQCMNTNTTNIKATALEEDTLRRQAPSSFAAGPMAGRTGRQW